MDAAAESGRNSVSKHQIQPESCCLKENLNASRPSEHPPVREENVKTFSGIIGCKDKTSSHIQRIGCQLEKITLHGEIPLVVC